MPLIVAILGYAGLIPFIALAGFCIAFSGNDQVRLALDLYAFGIISFLCGAWWPTAPMQGLRLRPILLSNVLFLAAFFGLVFLHDVWLLIATALILLILYIEQYTAVLPPSATNYRQMRIVLSGVAGLSLLAVYVFGGN